MSTYTNGRPKGETTAGQSGAQCMTSPQSETPTGCETYASRQEYLRQWMLILSHRLILKLSKSKAAMAINEIKVDVNRYLALSDEYNNVAKPQEQESELDL